jgi:outer membrane lipoprotein-sorting protein
MRAYTLLTFIFLLPGCSAISIQPTPYPGTTPDTLRAEAIVELEKEEFRGRAVILLKRPNLARIDFLGPFNQVVAVIVSDGTELTFYSNGGVRSYRWDDPRLPYSFSPWEFVSFLFGRPVDGGQYELTRDEKGNIQRLVKLRAGIPVLKVAMGDWRQVRGVFIPFEIAIEDEQERLDIRFSSVELNTRMEKELFIIPVRGLDRRKETP